MDKQKPEKLSYETKAFESAMTREETERAIYIDFEGFVDKAPALIGVAIEADFNQVAFDPGLELAAMAKGNVDPTGRPVYRGAACKGPQGEASYRRLFAARKEGL